MPVPNDRQQGFSIYNVPPDIELNDELIVECAKRAFDESATDRPGDAHSLGVAEEAGELSHAILKRIQGIRGFDDPVKARTKIGDSAADIVVYLIQMMTCERLDFETLLVLTATKVMRRDFHKDKHLGGEK